MDNDDGCSSSSKVVLKWRDRLFASVCIILQNDSTIASTNESTNTNLNMNLNLFVFESFVYHCIRYSVRVKCIRDISYYAF